jgi:Double-stranded RNA binding motif
MKRLGKIILGWFFGEQESLTSYRNFCSTFFLFPLKSMRSSLNSGFVRCLSHQLHKANVTPTVELNALAMKRGEPTSYALLEPLPAAFPPVYHRPLPFQRFHFNKQPVYPMAPPPVFYVTLKVGDREFSGQGKTAQTAKHDAAAKALLELKALPMPESSSQENGQVQSKSLQLNLIS